MNYELMNQKQALNCYPYGSRVYGTHTAESDYDYIVVTKGELGTKEEMASDNFNYTFYDEKSFSEAIKDHEISVLECLFLPADQVFMKNRDFDFQLNPAALRRSVSAKSSNSWVKAKKKFEVEKDFNPHIAKKSLFHSFRILLFGAQIAKYGKISDFAEANPYWRQILTVDSEKWDDYKILFQPVYNELKTEFKKVAPEK